MLSKLSELHSLRTGLYDNAVANVDRVHYLMSTHSLYIQYIRTCLHSRKFQRSDILSKVDECRGIPKEIPQKHEPHNVATIVNEG